MFCYFIPTEKDFYEDIKGRTDYFDFSNYPKDHPNYDTSKKLIPGYFKDEFGGELIDEFCGLRSKMYSIKTASGDEKKTGNGILQQVKKYLITHEDYRNSLLNQEVRYHKGTKIFQRKHNLHTVDIAKRTLNPYNDKRWITFHDGEYTCYSHGHYKIRK